MGWLLVGETANPVAGLFETSAEAPEISALEILIVLALGLALFGGIWAVRRVAPLVPMLRVQRERLARFGPVIELFVWVTYLAASIAWLLGSYPIVRFVALGVIALAVILASWFAIRDYLAGVILRAERAYRVGDDLVVGEVTGRVKNLGFRTLEVELKGGHSVFLPYSKISQTAMTRGDGESRHRFTLEVAPGVDVTAARRAILRGVLLSHWSSPRHDPQIRALGGRRFEVRVRCLAEERAVDLEQAVRRSVAELGQ